LLKPRQSAVPATKQLGIGFGDAGFDGLTQPGRGDGLLKAHPFTHAFRVDVRKEKRIFITGSSLAGGG
jgi:hypothetical protein